MGYFFGGNRSGTFEKIDWRSTILGILAPIIVTLAVLLALALAIVTIAVAAGEQFGAFVLVAAGVYYSVFVDKRGMEPHVKQARILTVYAMVAIAGIGTAVAFFDAWPRVIVDWTYIDGVGYTVSWFNRPDVAIPAWLLLVRAVVVVIGAAMLGTLARGLEALAVEITHPKAREAPVAAVDPESIRRGAHTVRARPQREPRVIGEAEGLDEEEVIVG